MSQLSPYQPADATADPTAELTRRAAFLRPDLETAFTDDGWIAVRIRDVTITSAGLAFSAGDLALVRPAVARHPSAFLAFSERLGNLVGLRHGDHFHFADEPWVQA
jgi:hypothetical protein